MKIAAAAALALVTSGAWAQNHAPADSAPAQPPMDHSQHAMPMEPSQHESTSDTDQDAKQTAPAADRTSGTTGSEHGSMSMQGGAVPPDARDPHAYSDGYDLGPLKLQLADTHSLGSLLVDNLETVRTTGNTFAAYDVQGWYGRTYDRAVLKAEGKIDDGDTKEARTELLWGHAIAAFWDTQLGLRVDGGDGPNRRWLAFGVQGLAPYWFEAEATGYLGEDGRSALRLEAEYELLLTQRLILQPRIEAEWYGKRDPERGLGSGLSQLTTGLRLRYEIRREFAPYVGFEWARKYGATEDFARAAGDDPQESRVVAGLRFWF